MELIIKLVLLDNILLGYLLVLIAQQENIVILIQECWIALQGHIAH